MKRAVFLDRDGTIIELVHHLTDPADVKLISGAGPAITSLRSAGYTVVIVTNQSVIGRGKLTEEGLEEVHAEMLAQLAKHDAFVDAIYFCPLAPLQRDPTIIEDPMRKPGPGMLLAAAEDLDLDLSGSWMIGDTVSDILAGNSAGCRSILVKTGYGADVPDGIGIIDKVVGDLSDAARTILDEDPS